MRRRALFAALAQVVMPEDERIRLTAWFGDFAAALSQDDGARFIRAFGKDMPGRSRLEATIFALLRGYTVASAVELREITPQGEARTVRADWALSLKPRDGSVVAASRRKILEFVLERDGKGWRIKSFADVPFFEPPAP